MEAPCSGIAHRLLSGRHFFQVKPNQNMLLLMRKESDRIVNIGALGGGMSLPFYGAIASSKIAFEAGNDCLRPENIDKTVLKALQAIRPKVQLLLSPTLWCTINNTFIFRYLTHKPSSFWHYISRFVSYCSFYRMPWSTFHIQS